MADSPALKLYSRGTDLFKNGKLDEAIDCFKRAAEVDPKFFRAWAYLGMAYAQQEKIDEAIDAYRKCIDIDGRYHKALNNCGELYLRKGMLDYAAMVFKMATEADPTQAQYFYNLGIAYSEIGMRPQAEDALAEACRLDPTDFGGITELAQIRFTLKKYDAATQTLATFLQKNPDHPRGSEIGARLNLLKRKAGEELAKPKVQTPLRDTPSSVRRATLDETD